MDGFQVVAAKPEEVLNLTVNGEEPLSLADRFERKWMVFFGGVMAALSLLFIPLCRSFVQLFVVNLFLGVMLGFYMPAMMAMAVDTGRRAGHMVRVMSLLEMSFSIGMVVGPLLAGLVMEILNVRAVFWAGSLIGVGTSLVFASFYPGSRMRSD